MKNLWSILRWWNVGATCFWLAFKTTGFVDAIYGVFILLMMVEWTLDRNRGKK